MVRFDFSKRGKARVYLLTAIVSLFCVGVSLLVDSYSFGTNSWRWGTNPLNDVLLPMLLAPPLLWFLLTKLRELAIAHDELMTVAATDGLTQCLNRRAFTAVVDGYLARMENQSRESSGALLVIDVDHFKRVNDTFGHGEGDEALRLIANSLRQAVREGDVVGRLGGEEFAVFMPGIGIDQTRTLSERIRQQVRQTRFEPGTGAYSLSVSVGGVSFAGPASFSELYRLADERLYSAKNDGRDRVEIQPYVARAA